MQTAGKDHPSLEGQSNDNDMNEIGLYRGKRTDNGEWVEGWLWEHSVRGVKSSVIGEGTTASSINGFEVDPSTVGLYTGWNDKTGKKIFQGDFDAGGCCWVFGKMGWEIHILSVYDHNEVEEVLSGDDIDKVIRNFKITGNIHDL
jgi:hypothetical protein